MTSLSARMTLAVFAIASSAAQTPSAYRIAKGAAAAYQATSGDGYLRIIRADARGIAVSIVPQKGDTTSNAGRLAGDISVSKIATVAGARNVESSQYVGFFGSQFTLRDGNYDIFVSYVDSDVNLRISVVIADGTLKVVGAGYGGGCDDTISVSAEKYLNSWVTAVANPIPVPQSSHLELHVPHPSEKALLTQGEKESGRKSCSSLFDNDKYYDLKITSVPAAAAVYINSKYISQSGEPIKVNNNPAHVLIRHDKCQDLAASVPLHDGPNDVSVQLVCSK
jgi:hypothetical protein